MITVRFDNEIQQAAPSLEVLAIEAELTNPPTSDALWAEVTDTASGIAGADLQAFSGPVPKFLQFQQNHIAFLLKITPVCRSGRGQKIQRRVFLR